MSFSELKTLVEKSVPPVKRVRKPRTSMPKLAPLTADVSVDKSMISNSSGSKVFETSDKMKLKRFLILGTTANRMYSTPQKDMNKYTATIKEMVNKNPLETIELIANVSNQGLAKNNDYALYALAVALSYGDNSAKYLVQQALPYVARTGTHLFHFVAFASEMRGWGRSLVNTLRAWYLTKDPESLAYNIVKYRSRDGWSHRDIFRKIHIRPQTSDMDAIMAWTTRGKVSLNTPSIMKAYEVAKTARLKDLPDLIRAHKLTHEMIPPEHKNNVEVWKALLPDMKIQALLRNSNKLTQLGLLSNLTDTQNTYKRILLDETSLRNQRVHPFSVFASRAQYKTGRGNLGSSHWTPVDSVVSTMEEAFYKSFQFVEPTGKNIMLGIDVSGSMRMNKVLGMEYLNAATAAGLLAMTTIRSEANAYAYGFTAGLESFKDLHLRKSDTIEEVVKKCSLPFGPTQLDLPMRYALEKKLDVDAFVIYTDNEVNAGYHPAQMLNKYRKEMNKPDAKMIVCAFALNNFSIADPQDPNQLDVVGVSTDSPSIISDFIAGKI